MDIVIGSDHAGYPLKKELVEFLKLAGHEVDDVGSFDSQPVDFPDIAQLVCSKVVEDVRRRGLLVCGTGVGAVIAANKIKGIRAAVCHDFHSAHQSVEHDDVNVMCLGAQIVGPWLARDLVDAYLSAEFEGGEDFVRRLEKIARLESPGSH
ncbi:ribose 5-phosphate isomerase B [Halotalea alkalilenta]|uniref:ribose 5-phosphate isomerase B n=1 Tax=Halotalea alkalilenta TaxID=376489 RepID=UPI0004865743|nr:ribose 5-phosphate isomerase B [Halotalea alkalilenta]